MVAGGPIDNQDQNNLYMELARILRVGIDKESLNICIKLIQDGCNPESLAVLQSELYHEINNK